MIPWICSMSICHFSVPTGELMQSFHYFLLIPDNHASQKTQLQHMWSPCGYLFLAQAKGIFIIYSILFHLSPPLNQWQICFIQVFYCSLCKGYRLSIFLNTLHLVKLFQKSWQLSSKEQWIWHMIGAPGALSSTLSNNKEVIVIKTPVQKNQKAQPTFTRCLSVWKD